MSLKGQSWLVRFTDVLPLSLPDRSPERRRSTWPSAWVTETPSTLLTSLPRTGNRCWTGPAEGVADGRTVVTSINVDDAHACFSANLDKQTDGGSTALHYCCLMDNSECLKLLLRGKASMSIGESINANITTKKLALSRIKCSPNLILFGPQGQDGCCCHTWTCNRAEET